MLDGESCCGEQQDKRDGVGGSVGAPRVQWGDPQLPGGLVMGGSKRLSAMKASKLTMRNF